MCQRIPLDVKVSCAKLRLRQSPPNSCLAPPHDPHCRYFARSGGAFHCPVDSSLDSIKTVVAVVMVIERNTLVQVTASTVQS